MFSIKKKNSPIVLSMTLKGSDWAFIKANDML